MTTQEPTAVTPATANSTVATPTTATVVRHMTEIYEEVDSAVSNNFKDFDATVSAITFKIIQVMADRVRTEIKKESFKHSVIGLKEESHKFYISCDLLETFGFCSIRDTLYGENSSSKFNCLIFEQVKENLLAENIELYYDVNICDDAFNAVWTKKIKPHEIDL